MKGRKPIAACNLDGLIERMILSSGWIGESVNQADSGKLKYASSYLSASDGMAKHLTTLPSRIPLRSW